MSTTEVPAEILLYTVNHGAEAVTKYLDSAERLFEQVGGARFQASDFVLAPMAAQAIVEMMYAESLLDKMIRGPASSSDIDINAVKKINIHHGRCYDKYVLETLHKEFTFIRGAVVDPFLYSDRRQFQQAAAVGILKARQILRIRIAYLQLSGN